MHGGPVLLPAGTSGSGGGRRRQRRQQVQHRHLPMNFKSVMLHVVMLLARREDRTSRRGSDRRVCSAWSLGANLHAFKSMASGPICALQLPLGSAAASGLCMSTACARSEALGCCSSPLLLYL